MNKNPALASAWKGRILVEYWVDECNHPISLRRNISNETQSSEERRRISINSSMSSLHSASEIKND